MGGATHFEESAEEYDAARPPYPPALWNRLRTLGLLEPGRSALDLGAGSGQATGPLLAEGLAVTAVEPGARLARLLAQGYPDADVVIARAEDADLPARRFDLAVAATSVHWFDLDVMLPKLTAALAPGGRFAVWRNVFGDAEAPVTPFRRRIAEIVAARRGPGRPGPPAEDLAAMTAALTASGLFSVVDTSTWRWTIELDATAVGRLFRTFSDWSAEEAAAAAAAVTDLGGVVTEHYSSWLLVLAPVEDPAG